MQMNNHSLEKQNNWIKIKEHVKIFMKEERPTSHSHFHHAKNATWLFPSLHVEAENNDVGNS